MVVGIIDPIGGHGGMSYYNYGLSMGLGASNVDVRYYTCEQTIIREFPNVTTIISFRKLWASKFVMKVLRYIAGHLRAYSDLKKHKGEVVHLHFFTFRSVDLIVLFFARMYKLKVVLTIHDVNPLDKAVSTFFERNCYLLSNYVIVHNEYSFGILKTKTFIKTEALIVPHGNYLPFIKEVSEEKNDNIFTLLFFGMIKEVKGLDVLLRAVALVKQKGYKFKLIVAGKAWKSDLEIYTKIIDDLQLNDIVETNFRFIPDDEVPLIYSKSDVIVLPYREVYQSGSLLSAMSYGKPVICSNITAFKEIIVDGFNGFLFKKDDEEDLASKIIYILNNKEILKSVVFEANDLIRNKFDWINIGAQTKEIYQKVLTA